MDENTPETDAGGLSRRAMLRRSALVGGTLVWTAPAIQTIAAPAFAAGSPGGDAPCTYTAFVKYDLPSTAEAAAKGPDPRTPPGGGGGGDGGGFSDSEGQESCRLPQCSQTNVTVKSTGTRSAELWSDGAKIGTVSASGQTETCITLAFTFLAGCSIDESRSSYIFKDGNDTGDGGRGCEAADSGSLDKVKTAPNTYKICSNGGQGGGLSHVNLCLCIACPTA